MFVLLLLLPLACPGQNVGRLENDSVFNGVKLGARFSDYMRYCSPAGSFKEGRGLMEWENANFDGVPVVEYLSVDGYKVNLVTCYVDGSDCQCYLSLLERRYGKAKYSYDDNAYVWFGRRAYLILYINYKGQGANVSLFAEKP